MTQQTQTRIRTRIRLAAAIVLQKYIRTFILKKHWKQLNSISLIQTFYRKYKSNKNYLILKYGLIFLQAAFRGIVVRKQITTIRISICLIQAYFRKYLCQKILLKIKNEAAMKFQHLFRNYINNKTMKIKQMKLLNENCIIKHLQLIEIFRNTHLLKIINKFVLKCIKKWKQIFARKIILRFFYSKLIFIRIHKLLKGFLRLQACYRSRKVKKASNRKIYEIYQKIKIVNYNAKINPNMQLGHKTKECLHVLQEGKMISHILNACKFLEFSTQISKRCCESFANASAANILFGLIRSCNRSTPHQELLR